MKLGSFDFDFVALLEAGGENYVRKYNCGQLQRRDVYSNGRGLKKESLKAPGRSIIDHVRS